MNLNIAELISHPDRLADCEVVDKLREVMEQYPYFHAVRLLYLKALYLMRDPSFGGELQRMALFIPDRKVLFDLIEGEYYTLRPMVHKTKRATGADGETPLADRTQLLIDAFLSGLPAGEEEERNSLLFPEEEREECPLAGGSSLSLSESIASLAEKGKTSHPTTDDGGLSSDYTAYVLRESDLTPTEEKVPPTHTTMQGQHLIDEFIKKADENIALREEEESGPLIGQETEILPEIDEDDGYFTETLAKIYIKQHRYGKALEIIRRLSLKYPKKNAYFADQIRFLEKLVLNFNDK